MRVIVVGGGTLGQQTAIALTAAGHQVTVVESDAHQASQLRSELSAHVLHGDGCEPQVLEQAGALKADILVAAMGADENNLLTCFLAKRHFEVPQVVARVNDPENRWLFTAQWGVDLAVSPSATLVSLIEEGTQSLDTVGLVRLGAGGPNVIETALHPSSRAVGKTLADLVLPLDCTVVAVIRDRHPLAMHHELRLAAQDRVLVLAETSSEVEVQNVFQGAQTPTARP